MQKEAINEVYFCHPELTAKRAQEEVLAGLQILNSINEPIVTIYGSHKVSPEDDMFKFCQKMVSKLSKDKFAFATGGGTGIMLAANSTAKIMGSKSIALKGAAFVDEHINADFYTHEYSFEFIFARRFTLCIKSDALVFFPGGYGTLNELFEILVLMQSGIIEKVPVILVQKEYWKGMFDWITEKLADGGMLTNNHDDVGLVKFVDSVDEAARIIREEGPKHRHNSDQKACKLAETIRNI